MLVLFKSMSGPASRRCDILILAHLNQNCFNLHRKLFYLSKWPMVTLSPPTSEAGVRFPAQPQVGKLVVACGWSAVYSTEP